MGTKKHIFMFQLVIVLLACTRTHGLDPVNKGKRMSPETSRKGMAIGRGF
jgi:hypothetical protein